ncbi:MAG: hypothetical protein HYY24_14820 [Verrucomicrobia bacterium]|nr:hypothetical protein [Verrucomicrobiota bacterium]
MTQLKVTLPDSLNEFVACQAAKSGKRTRAAYVTALIREVRQQEALKEVEAKLLAGLNSGPARAMTRADWAELRMKPREHLLL